MTKVVFIVKSVQTKRLRSAVRTIGVVSMNQMQRVAFAAMLGTLIGSLPYILVGISGLWLMASFAAGIGGAYVLYDLPSFVRGIRDAWRAMPEPPPVKRSDVAKAFKVVFVQLLGAGAFVIWGMSMMLHSFAIAAGMDYFIGDFRGAGLFAGMIVMCFLTFWAEEKRGVNHALFMFEQPLKSAWHFNPVGFLVWEVIALWQLACRVPRMTRFVLRYMALLYEVTVSDSRLASAAGATVGLSVCYCVGRLSDFTPGLNSSASLTLLCGLLAGAVAGYVLGQLHALRSAVVEVKPWR